MTDEHYYSECVLIQLKLKRLINWLKIIDKRDDSYNSVKETIFDLSSSIYDLMAEIMGEYS